MPYALKVVAFEAATDVFGFEDGWKLVEISTVPDLDLLGAATQNCIGYNWHYQLLPAPDDELEYLKQKFRTQWDTPKNREQFGDAWVEERCEGYKRCPLPKRHYRILALLDNESKARAAVILGEKAACDSGAAIYAGYRDLGQASTVCIDGTEFYLLQATMGPYWMPEDVAEHMATYWKANASSWDEEAFQKKVKQYARYRFAYA